MKVYADTTGDGTPCVVLEKYEPGCWICSGELSECFYKVRERNICHICMSMILDQQYDIEAGDKC